MKSELDQVRSMYIKLESVSYDPDQESLSIVVVIARQSEEIYRTNFDVTNDSEFRVEKLLDGSRQIIVDTNSKRYEIYFDYVLYFQICDEYDYNISDEKCDDDGIIGLVLESPLLKHLKSESGVFIRNPEAKLYLITTSSSWIRLVSSSLPAVRILAT